MDVQAYWQSLVQPTSSESVELVGHPDMGRAFNQRAYAVRLRAVLAALDAAGWHSRSRVFEAAYGVGFYLNHWLRLGCTEVSGVDISEAAWKEARRNFPNYDLRCGDLSRISAWSDWAKL